MSKNNCIEVNYSDVNVNNNKSNTKPPTMVTGFIFTNNPSHLGVSVMEKLVRELR